MKVTVGGYAAAGQDWGGADLASFYATLAAMPAVGGLEIPAAQLEQLASAQAGATAWSDRLQYEVTSLPATMSALQSSAEYGLASVSAAGRAAAMADAERMRTAVARFIDRLGRPAVTSLIIGGRTEAQFRDNLASVNVKLTDDERARLDKVSQPPLIYPYWHQSWTAKDRLGHADLALHAPYLKG